MKWYIHIYTYIYIFNTPKGVQVFKHLQTLKGIELYITEENSLYFVSCVYYEAFNMWTKCTSMLSGEVFHTKCLKCEQNVK